LFLALKGFKAAVKGMPGNLMEDTTISSSWLYALMSG